MCAPELQQRSTTLPSKTSQRLIASPLYAKWSIRVNLSRDQYRCGRAGPATGRSFEFRLASVGEVSEQGLVTTQRDYWDLAGLLAKFGVTG
jgi:hypothetical protein